MEADNKDKVISSLSKKVVFLTVLVFLLIAIILWLLLYTPMDTTNAGCGVTENFVCGNAVSKSKNREEVKELYGDDVDFDAGNKLYKQNCAVCHRLDEMELNGPGLRGVFNRVPSEEWLYHYVLNSDSMYKAKDAYAAHLREQYPKLRMTTFTYLNEEEIKNILAYVRVQAK